MLKLLRDVSLRYKVGTVFVVLLALLALALYLYVQIAAQQAQNARQLNQAGFTRALSQRLELLSREVSSAEANNATSLQAVQTVVLNNQGLVRALVGLFLSSQQVESDEFATFVAALESDYPFVDVFGFLPRVRAADRSAFEAQFGFTLYEQNAQGQNIPVTERAEYYPYQMAYPGPAQSLLGFDAASNPARLAALERARDEYLAIATAPVLSPGVPNDTPSTLIFFPLYEGDEVPSTLEQRRERLRGYVVVGIEIGPLLAQTAQTFGLEQSVASIRDVSDPIQAATLYENTILLAGDSFLSLTTLEVFGRTWEVTLAQPVDINTTLAELEATNARLAQIVGALGQGSESLGLVAIESYESEVLTQLYEEMRLDYLQVGEAMGSFLEAPTLAERLSNMESLHLFIDRFFEDSQLFVQALEDNNEATAASATRNASLLALISGLVVLISLAVTVYLVGQVRQVQRTAQSLSQGQFEARTGLNSGDEIGQIGAALDSLAGQVQGLLAGSEEVVQARTRQLQTVLDVNARISNILQVDRLLQDVSDVVKERFGLYHAHVYLLNPGQDRLVLTAGSGYVGRQMVAEGRVIDMKNLNSIAATAARTRTPVYVEDVRQSPTFLAHPLLPNTRSELSLPLIARGSVIGVLDVQSELLAFFDEQTQTILATMATQIATAISNARQFEQAEQTSRHEQAMNTIGQQLQTARTVDEVLRVASRELGKALRVPQTSIELQVQPEGPNPFSGPLTVEDN